MKMTKRALHTIKSGIVLDILGALAQNGMKNLYLGGGLSTQFFLPEELHRVTSDIDLDGPVNMPYIEFRDYMTGVGSPLTARGYSIDFSKQRGTQDAEFSRDENMMVVQIPRRSQGKFVASKQRLERELLNSEEIPYVGGKLRLININDLLARKIGRADDFRRQYDLTAPFGMDTLEAVERANLLKETLDYANLDPRELPKRVAYIRMLADLADIKAILERVKINENYLREAVRNYPTKNPASLESFLQQVLAGRVQKP